MSSDSLTLTALLEKFAEAGLTVSDYYSPGPDQTYTPASAVALGERFTLLEKYSLDTTGLVAAAARNLPISLDEAAAILADRPGQLEVLMEAPVDASTTPEQLAAYFPDAKDSFVGRTSKKADMVYDAYRLAYIDRVEDLLVYGMVPAATGSHVRHDTASVLDALALAGITDWNQVVNLVTSAQHRPHLLAALALSSSPAVEDLARVAEFPSRLRQGASLDELLASLDHDPEMILAAYGTSVQKLHVLAAAGRFDAQSDFEYRQSTGDRYLGSVEAELDRRHVRAAVAAAGLVEPSYESLLEAVDTLVETRVLSEDIFEAMDAGVQGFWSKINAAEHMPVEGLDPEMYYDWVRRSLTTVTEPDGGSWAKVTGVGDLLEPDNDASPRFADYMFARSSKYWLEKDTKRATEWAELEDLAPELSSWVVKVSRRASGPGKHRSF